MTALGRQKPHGFRERRINFFRRSLSSSGPIPSPSRRQATHLFTKSPLSSRGVPSKPMATGFSAVRSGIVMFAIPFVFAFYPELLLIDQALIDPSSGDKSFHCCPSDFHKIRFSFCRILSSSCSGSPGEKCAQFFSSDQTFQRIQ